MHGERVKQVGTNPHITDSDVHGDRVACMVKVAYRAW